MKYALVEKRSHVAIVTINYPEKRNIVSTEVFESLNEAFDEVDGMEDVYCVVLCGAGEKAFIGGADIKEMSRFDFYTAKEYSEFGSRVLNKIHDFRTPVICAIQGYCLGGGVEAALACDIRIAADNATFSQPEVTLGIMTGTGGARRLMRLIGEGRAKEMLFTGTPVGAKEALTIGLVNRVVPARDLMEEALKEAHKIAKNAPMAVSAMKRAMNAMEQMDERTGNEMATFYFASLFETEDAHDALEAFVNKEKMDEFHNR